MDSASFLSLVSSGISSGPLLLLGGVFALSCAAAWALTHWVRAFATAHGVVAKRDSRRRHERDTPLLGGVAFYLLIVSTMAALWILKPSGFAEVLTVRFTVCFLLAVTLVFVVGVWDDVVELKAAPKFAAEFAAAALILVAEPRLPALFPESPLPLVLGIPFLLLWIVGITNATNMIDGLDGLCAGVGGISALAIAAISITTGALVDWPALMMIVLAGACAGFLFHNFNPARIFLGDSGSLLIGFVLAVVSIKLSVKRSLIVSLSVPILVLGLPLLDAGLSILRRKRKERSVFRGDRSHIHHRLQQVGLSHRAAVIYLWAATAYLNATAFVLAHVPLVQSAYIYLSVLLTVGFWLVTLWFLERRLAFQVARYGHLFLRQRLSSFSERRELLLKLGEQVRATREHHRPFTVITVDSEQFLREIVHERPNQIVAFYMDLYGSLARRLRASDTVARVSEYRVVALLPDCGDTSDSEHAIRNIIEKLQADIRDLQERHGVFQTDPLRAEGVGVHTYPRDAERVWKSLNVTPDEIELIVRGEMLQAA